jgi:hypothetical protein
LFLVNQPEHEYISHFCSFPHRPSTPLPSVESSSRIAYDLNIGIYHDDGCCGCTTTRRRLLLFALSMVSLSVGFFGLLGGGGSASGTSANQQSPSSGLAIGGFGGALFWLITAMACPNGCCGVQYSRTGDSGRMNPAEFAAFVRAEACPFCDRGGSAGSAGSGAGSGAASNANVGDHAAAIAIDARAADHRSDASATGTRPLLSDDHASDAVTSTASAPGAPAAGERAEYHI